MTALGLVCFSIGALIQILEQYRHRGVTDLSFASLILILLGSVFICLNVLSGPDVFFNTCILIFSAAPLFLSSIVIYLKCKDLIHTTFRGKTGKELMRKILHHEPDRTAFNPEWMKPLATDKVSAAVTDSEKRTVKFRARNS